MGNESTINNENEIFKEIKISLLGNCQTGKTLSVNKLINKQFDKTTQYISTPGALYLNRRVVNKYGNFKFNIWDTGGKEIYFSLTRWFYKDAQIILIFYNFYDISSFEKAKTIINYVHEYNEQNPLIVLIRTRYDECLKNNDNRKIISDEEVLEFADRNNLLFIHYSNFEKYESGANELIKYIFRKVGYK